VRRWACLLSLWAAACSGLEEGEGGVVALEIEFPELRTLEIGEQVQLAARALDAEGDVVDAAIDWRASNAALSVDGTGLVSGVAAGTGEVQAVVGSLASERVGFTVVLRADTLIIEGDSVLAIPRDADPPATATLPVRLESFDPAGPVGSRPVIFEIVQPVAGETAVVELVGAGQSDTVATTADGLASVLLGAVAGQVPPDTAIVQIRANRTRGSPVPGSGQRFIVLFQ
jgi:hypothetical protein